MLNRRRHYPQLVNKLTDFIAILFHIYLKLKTHLWLDEAQHTNAIIDRQTHMKSTNDSP